MPKKDKIALVISGGGSQGAFAVGVIKYLFEKYRNSGWFDIVGGTSTGALITPVAGLMAAPLPEAQEALELLIKLYTTKKTEDILRKRCILEFLFKWDALSETAPLYSIIKKDFTKEWFAWLKSPKSPYTYVVYTNYKTGEKVHVSPKDQNTTHECFMKAILASCSVPVYMEPARINKQACFDGGARDLLPLAKAIDLGATKILQIIFDPPQFPHSADSFERMDKILFRTLGIMINEGLQNDISMAKLINAGVNTRYQILKLVKGNSKLEKSVKNVFNSYPDLFGYHRRIIQIIEGLQPDRVLTEMAFEFNPAEMSEWMEWGYEKAEKIITENPFD